jgi:hypothetical protein
VSLLSRSKAVLHIGITQYHLEPPREICSFEHKLGKTERSYRPFATNRSLSSARNLSTDYFFLKQLFWWYWLWSGPV